MRTILLFIFVALAIVAEAQLTGQTGPIINTNYTYTYDDGTRKLGGVNWTATGGTVVSNVNPGFPSSTYTAVISFQTAGSQTITAKTFQGATLDTHAVTAVNPPDPTLVAGSIGSNQTVAALGTAPSLLTNSSSASGGNGSYAYQWQEYKTSWANLSGKTSATYQPASLNLFAPEWSSIIKYRRRVISGSQTKYSNELTMTVKKLNPGSISNAQTLCYNGNPSTLTNTASASNHVGTRVFKWQVSTTGSGGWVDISSTNSTAYNPGNLTANRWYRRRVQAGGSTKYSNSIKVTIYPNLSPGSISGAVTMCYNGNPSALSSTASASGGNGSLTYLWQYSDDGSSWTDLTGESSTTYDPGSLTADTWYRRSVESANCTGYKYTGSVKITVNPSVNAGSIGNAQTVCYNGNATAFTNTASASSGDYQWQYYSGGSWVNVSGATSATYDPPVLTTTRDYRRRVISCLETKYSNTIRVTVETDLNAGSIGNAQTLCYNSDPGTLSSTSSASGGSATKIYQWQHRSPGGTWTDFRSDQGIS